MLFDGLSLLCLVLHELRLVDSGADILVSVNEIVALVSELWVLWVVTMLGSKISHDGDGLAHHGSIFELQGRNLLVWHGWLKFSPLVKSK